MAVNTLRRVFMADLLDGSQQMQLMGGGIRSRCLHSLVADVSGEVHGNASRAAHAALPKFNASPL
jgi:hypothetical protein